MAAAYFVCHIGPIFQIFLIYAFIGSFAKKALLSATSSICHFCRRWRWRAAAGRPRVHRQTAALFNLLLLSKFETHTPQLFLFWSLFLRPSPKQTIKLAQKCSNSFILVQNWSNSLKLSYSRIESSNTCSQSGRIIFRTLMIYGDT